MTVPKPAAREGLVSRFTRSPVAWVLLIIVGIFVGLPVLMLVLTAFQGVDGTPSLESFTAAFQQKRTWTSLLNTVVISVFATVIATIIGAILAFAATKVFQKKSWTLRILPIAPLLIANLVGAIGWVFLLAPNTGWINALLRTSGWFGESGPLDIFSIEGAIWVTALYITPFVFSVLSASLDRIGPEVFEAYVVNGSSPGVALWRVLLGPLRPALMGAMILAFVESIVQFSIPLVLQVDVLTTDIYRSIHSANSSASIAAALTVPLVIFAIGAMLIERQVLGRRAFSGNQGRGISSRGWAVSGAVRKSYLTVSVVYVFLSVVLPLLAIVLVSILPFWKPSFQITDFTLRHYVGFFDSPMLLTPLANSVGLALVVAVAVVVLAFAISRIRVASPSGVGRALYFLANVPLAIPSIVLGLAFLVIYLRPPVSQVLFGTFAGLAIAYTVHYLPIGLRNIFPVMSQQGPQLDEAVQVSGGGTWHRLRDAAIPMTLPGMTSAFFMVAIFAVREFPMSAVLSTPQFKVVAVTLVDVSQSGTYSKVAVLAIALSVVNLLFVFISTALNSRVVTDKRSRAPKKVDVSTTAVPRERHVNEVV